MLQSAKELRSTRLQAIDGEIGLLDDLYFDYIEWKVRYLVANAGSWLSGRRILLSPLAMTGAPDANSRIQMNLTTKQIEESPRVDETTPVSTQQEIDLHVHYGWNFYGYGPGISGTHSQGLYDRSGDDRRQNAEDPQLRSAEEVSGYRISAREEKLGQLEDLIVDDITWKVRYLVVDTAPLWFGKKVLISPKWIQKVDWGNRSVRVSLSADDLKEAPEWDGLTPIEPDYDEKLFIHYGRSNYVV